MMNARKNKSMQQLAQPLHDHAAEARVLGSLLVNPSGSWPEAYAADLTVEEFTGPGHRDIFAAGREQFERGQEADAIGVYQRLRAQGLGDDGLLLHLNELSQNSAPGPGSLRRLTRTLREMRQRRELINELESGTLIDALEKSEQIKASQSQGSDIKLLDVGAMLDSDMPALDFVLPGLLAGTVGMLVSPGSAGKTMLAVQLAVLVATGGDTLEISGLLDKYHKDPGRVVYLTAEDPVEIMQGRIKAIASLLTPLQRQLMRENLIIGDLRGRGADILDSAWRARISLVSHGARLVILDTLRRFHLADENDSGEAAKLLATIEAISRDCGTTFLILHHTNKSGGRENGGDQQAARGSSVLTDNARLQVNLVRMTEKEAKDLGVAESMRSHFVRVVFAKINYCAPIKDIWLHRTSGGVLEPAYFGRAGAVHIDQLQPQPEPAINGKNGKGGGGLVINGETGWEVLK